MRIIDAVNALNKLKHNTYSTGEKILWLSKVDGMVKRLIIDTHEGGEMINFTGYDENTPEDTELLVPAPYDTVYLRWLEAQVDYHNGEYGKYNNAIMLYNTEFQAYADDYNRSHMPLTKKSGFC